jgi:hypothetical protein
MADEYDDGYSSSDSEGEQLIGGAATQPPENILPEAELTATDVNVLPIKNRKKYLELRDDLLAKLDAITIPRIPKPAETSHSNRGNVIGTIGRTAVFGFGDNRHGWNFYSTNKQHPEVFKALVKFGNFIAPKGWRYQGMNVNHMVKAKKHKDRKNVGKSVIVGIGGYDGGLLKIWDGNDKNPKAYDIQDKPTMFNGGMLFHQTTPFTGNRYTIVFYKQKRRPRSGDFGVGSGAGHEELEGCGGVIA